MLGEKIERLIPQRGVAGEFRRGLGAEAQPEPEPSLRECVLLWRLLVVLILIFFSGWPDCVRETD